MPISRSTRRQRVHQQVIDLCWGAWAELGVSGWARTHRDWAIDPEPLIVFTSGVADAEPRLRDEVLDWCIHSWRHISQTRLRNILIDQDDELLEKWGSFAATINRSASTRWPEATEPRSYETTGRSTLRPLSEPSLICLRMRAIFGLGARTEILRYLLLSQERSTAAVLAERTNYAKRNVAEACDTLLLAGLLHSKTVGNRFYYSLADPNSLEDFVGTIPQTAPDWNALLRVVGTILRLAEAAPTYSRDVLVVETHQVASDMEDDLDLLGIESPNRIRGAAFVDVWDNWVASVMRELASGKWPATATSTVVRLNSGAPRKRVRAVAR